MQPNAIIRNPLNGRLGAFYTPNELECYPHPKTSLRGAQEATEVYEVYIVKQQSRIPTMELLTKASDRNIGTAFKNFKAN